jgi:hypothetical protein
MPVWLAKQQMAARVVALLQAHCLMLGPHTSKAIYYRICQSSFLFFHEDMAYFSCTGPMPGHPLGVAVTNYHTHGAVGIDAAGIEWYLCVYIYIYNMCSMPGIRAGCLNHQTVQNQPSWPVTTAEPLGHPSALFLTLFCDLSQTASVIHVNSLQGDWQSRIPSLRTLCHANNRNKRSYTATRQRDADVLDHRYRFLAVV